ncbi:TetR family transcriptional regulator C-terminal domain-containing protein [Pontimicrobium aquaticum]|uniref:TetR/AcrR family transcriptional regulator n=1 Tax=Pontimicrobium aquaticum TaxID=2565367 RepID=A0A4U0EV92_9FLAO|nr:TetR family transcriptional regulator C-terminal domain-containing protein [Pontimicrobium aquaticum]TJY35836.1 TetR/AcrR family transcriptional regulator [Pontimicrobium aquaticum]
MRKKKSKSSSDIIDNYMDYVLEHNTQPKSVYSFAKANNFEETEFYKYFGNFEALEQSVFKAFFDNALTVLDKSEEYKLFDTRNKLLSFYYTFFEILTANRSYVVNVLSNKTDKLKTLRTLIKLKQSFTAYIETLEISRLEVKQETLEKVQDKTLKESAWIQLMITMKFWIEDTSPSFEKTDIFIEKAVNTSFDLIDIKPLKSIIDLGKFLYKEKMHIN